MNIHNFVNRQLCEYQTIFPTVSCVLSHLLYTNGTGYYFRKEIGMIVDDNGVRIDEYPAMTDAEWDELIQQCHAKEREYAVKFATHRPVDEEELAADCALYKRHNVDDSAFTAEALYADLCKRRAAKVDQSYNSWVRPYPFMKGYAYIYDLDENTPKWFTQIALNSANAWIKFLTEELDNGNVWIEHSLRKRKENSFVAEAMAELRTAIKSDPSYDGWLDRPMPTSDYADVNWTTKHRDELIVLAQQLETLL